MAPARSSGHETPKPSSLGHRECLGKKVVAKEANRVSAKCAILEPQGLERDLFTVVEIFRDVDVSAEALDTNVFPMAAVVGAELYTGTILKCSLQTRAALDVIRSAVDDDG